MSETLTFFDYAAALADDDDDQTADELAEHVVGCLESAGVLGFGQERGAAA